jgi:hypothetical protein
MSDERSDAPLQDEGAPPGFMDRTEVKEAVEWALARAKDPTPRPPGRRVADIFADFEERERLRKLAAGD